MDEKVSVGGARHCALVVGGAHGRAVDGGGGKTMGVGGVAWLRAVEEVVWSYT